MLLAVVFAHQIVNIYFNLGPSGWTDIGVSCKKPSDYGRGAGYPW